MSANVFQTVNAHCLSRLTSLATRAEMVAADDIFDHKGVKLWAKGGKMTPELQTRLMNRKLKTPLELTLELERSLSPGEVVDDCMKVILGNPILARLAGSKPALAALTRLRLIRLPAVLRLLTSASYENKQGPAYQHALYTLAIAAGFAAHTRLDPTDTDALLVASILHDLGELYVNPAYLEPERPLTSAEWFAVATHPRVSRLVAEELGKLPDAVGIGISQHHERLDGSGYPAMLSQSKLSRVGAVLAAADATAAIIRQARPGQAYRAALALKVIPEEFDKDVKAYLCGSLQNYVDDRVLDDSACIEDVQSVVQDLDSLFANSQPLLGHASGAVREIGALTAGVAVNVRKAMRATGVEFLLQLPTEAVNESAAWDEVRHVLGEARWRLRNVQRNLLLRHANLSESERQAIAPVMTA